MRQARVPAAPSGTAGRAGGVIHVPAPATEAALPPADGPLTQAERAERALAEGRRPKEVPIDRAFLAACLDLPRTLRVLTSAFVPRFADWCWVDLLDAEGIPHRVEVAHAAPADAALAARMRALDVGAGWATPSAQSIRDLAPRLFREVTDEVMAWATHGEQHLAVLRAMRPSSLLSVPLVARDRRLGAVTLVRSTIVPALSEADLVLAQEIAVPAALAIDNARAFEAAAKR
jgi:GAF domain-containing protein